MEFMVRIDPADDAARALLLQLAERGEVAPMTRGHGAALVLGGARSGKSSWAESQFDGVADVEYVATSQSRADDPEWVERVALHRARRPDAWRTTETTDLASVLRADDATPVLIDCLGTCLTRRPRRVEVFGHRLVTVEYLGPASWLSCRSARARRSGR